MINYGDITKIDGHAVPPVDVVIGGSPCQDLSVAGKRKGMSGERSGLFMEQIRIVKEMRENDRMRGRTGVDVRPRYMVWENVVGAFSSNGGKISGQSYKKRQKSTTKMPLFLNLRKESGQTAEPLWETDGASLGEFTTHSFGESPSVAVESHLLQILEENPHPRYYLSAEACRGILRRAERRGKSLKEELKTALMLQARIKQSATASPPSEATQ